jgi:hypothetical protein
MEYFGEEIGFYFGFLAHYTTGLTPLAPFAVAAQVDSWWWDWEWVGWWSGGWVVGCGRQAGRQVGGSGE